LNSEALMAGLGTDGNSNVVGGFEFLHGIEEVEHATGCADLDKIWTFLISAPPAKSDIRDGVQGLFPTFDKLAGGQKIAPVKIGRHGESVPE
jgi:hypothetical protein